MSWNNVGTVEDVNNNMYTLEITTNSGDVYKMAKGSYKNWENVMEKATLLHFTGNNAFIKSNKEGYFGDIDDEMYVFGKYNDDK